LAEAPREFGEFGHDVLLVGNFGDGTINAFNIQTGASLGPLKNRRGALVLGRDTGSSNPFGR
jgi:hypothetical protein